MNEDNKRTIPMLLTPEEAYLIKKCREDKLLRKAVFNFFSAMAGLNDKS